MLVLLAVAWAAGCGREKPAPPSPAPASPSTEAVWVRHILVQYVGAQGAGGHVKRNRTSADSLAKALRARVAAGEDFAALARQFSDDASATDGGEIAALQPGDAPPEFEHAAHALKPG